MFPQNDLDAIRESFTAVLEHYGINPSRDFRIPWRDDSKPSGHYSPESNLITDFGRNERYDVFAFVGRMDGLGGFKEQVERAAEIVGLQLGEEPAYNPNRIRATQARPKFEPPCDAGFGNMPLLPYAGMMADCLESEIAMTYLHGRGFCNVVVWESVLGFVPSSDAFRDSGIAFTLHEPNRPSGYIVIPFPADGSFCQVNYCMLRAIPGDRKPQHKEIRPSGVKSPLYREYLLSGGFDTVYVTEGLLDCIALEQLLGRPCVGLGGANFTKRMASVLHATRPELRPKKIILALDADEPGRKASEQITADLKQLGIAHGACNMPPGCKDPCDVLEQVQNGNHPR